LVKIDRTGDEIKDLTWTRNSVFVEEHLFLKVLVEGEASLYKYQDGNFVCYFYSSVDRNIEPLIYKRSLTEKNDIKVNNQYRQQLTNYVDCGDLKKEISRLTYKESPLLKYFLSYNNCRGGNVIDLSRQKRVNFFHVRAKTGLNHASLTLKSASDVPGYIAPPIEFESRTTFRFGLEAEFSLPFNNDKWSVLIEPTFEYYKSDPVLSIGNLPPTDYKAIVVPIGGRYYMFLNDRSKLFLNVHYSLNLAMGSNVGALELNTFSPRNDLSGGIGIQLNQISAEFRYTARGNLTGDYIFWRGEYNKISLIFGYEIK
jgi:hypothetical protein